MRVMPAIDLREGACVQLVGGRYEDERVRIADPLEAARRWRAAAFAELHVVDLDGRRRPRLEHRAVRASSPSPGSRSRPAAACATTPPCARCSTPARRGSSWDARPRGSGHGSPASPDVSGRVVVAADVRAAVVTYGWARTAAPTSVR
jgi:phosphoribosylformimino-5-aminoimidazole carboxamide ribotide isomerase